jgi:DNA-binding NarL/FixJ family response regulator
VLLADDHELVLDMLRSLLEPEFDVVGVAPDGNVLLRLARELTPDLILVDVVMPGLSGLEAGKALRDDGSGAKLVYLTMETDPAVAAEAFAIGASAYLSKVGPAAELQRVLRLVAAGGRYLTPAIANGDIKALCANHSTSPMTRLSPRELEVLKLLVIGMPMKTVARQLGITARTVAFHKYRAMEVLGLRDNAGLIDFAVRHGLLRRKGQPVADDDHG